MEFDGVYRVIDFGTATKGEHYSPMPERVLNEGPNAGLKKAE